MFFLICFFWNVWAELPIKTQKLGVSVTGRPIYGEFLGSGPKVLLMVASVHGNEWVGTPLLQYLQQYLKQHPELLKDKTLILIPMLNPDGWVDNMRSNRQRVDLNRNFPTQNYGRGLTGEYPLSAPESRILYDVIEKYKPRLIVGIHQPFACVDYDGNNVEDLARRMSVLSKLPLRKLGVRSGSMGAYVREKYPLITLEMHYNDHNLSMSKMWKTYGTSLLEAIHYLD